MPSCLFLGEEEVAVHHDFENAAGRGGQLDLDAGEMLLQLSRQTGGSWLVVSNDAEFDANSHGRLPVRGSLANRSGGPKPCQGRARTVTQRLVPGSGGAYL